MPGNNNLVVTVCHALVFILNVSTGKFTGATCSLIQGQTLSIEINELGTLMWVGNDRGYIEVGCLLLKCLFIESITYFFQTIFSCQSFRLESNLNKIHKGCRIHACANNCAVTSLSSHMPVKKLSPHPCLMATVSTEEIYIYAITDANGKILFFDLHMRNYSFQDDSDFRLPISSSYFVRRFGQHTPVFCFL